MRKRDRDALHRTLLEHRRRLLKEVADTEADLAVIEDRREAEIEETAAEDRMRRLLDRLDHRAKDEVEEIDRALLRLVDGTYGICTRCRAPIGPARLNALPAAPYCIDCARAIERGAPVEGAAERETSPRPSLPPEYALLSDRELQEAVREQLTADKRLDLDELRIVCRHGVLYLDGEVPSEAEHQIVLHTLTDVMGLPAVEDRMRAQGTPWQRVERAPGEEVPAARPPWEESPANDDVIETIEEGADFEAATEPVPDEE